jgi:CBS domain-containing protein
MKAQDVMTTPVIVVELDTPIQSIARLLIEHRISAVPVVRDDGRLAGIVSEGDLVRRPELGTERQAGWWLGLVGGHEARAAEYIRSHGRVARDVMTERVVSVDEDTPLAEIASLLEKHRIKRVPVMRDQRPIGIVSRANLVQAFAAIEAHVPEPSADARELRRTVLRNIGNAGLRTSLLTVIADGGGVHIWGAVRSETEREAIRVAAEEVVPPERVSYHVECTRSDAV